MCPLDKQPVKNAVDIVDMAVVEPSNFFFTFEQVDVAKTRLGLLVSCVLA